MEEKFNQSELSAMLAKQCGLSANKADTFTRTFFEAIIEGLENDGIVKVNGLGTFKIIDVASRTSIDVNSGEKIEIKEHRKITFTPSDALKDKVNAPFAMFEPVEIDDEYIDDELENISDVYSEYDFVDESSTSVQTVAVETASVDSSASAQTTAVETASVDSSASAQTVAVETASADTSTSAQTATVESTSADSSASAQTTAVESTSVDSSASAQTATVESSSAEAIADTKIKKNNYLYIFTLLSVLIAGVVIYFIAVTNDDIPQQNDIKTNIAQKVEVIPLDTVVEKDTTNLNIKKQENIVPFVMVDELAQIKLSEISIKDTLHYKIVGNMTVHKVGLDETLVKISHKYYNDKRLWQYIVKHNNLRDFNQLEIGMEIQIPLLVSRNEAPN